MGPVIFRLRPVVPSDRPGEGVGAFGQDRSPLALPSVRDQVHIEPLLQQQDQAGNPAVSLLVQALYKVSVELRASLKNDGRCLFQAQPKLVPAQQCQQTVRA